MTKVDTKIDVKLLTLKLKELTEMIKNFAVPMLFQIQKEGRSAACANDFPQTMVCCSYLLQNEYKSLLRPIHAMLFVSCDSFLLLC